MPATGTPAAPAPTAAANGGAAIAGIAAEISASAGVSAQNSVHADAPAASDAQPAQATGPDAASALAAAGAAATAAAVAGAARVITTLAAGTAVDEKRLRAGDVSNVSAAPAAGIDGSAAAGAAQALAGTTSASTDAPNAAMKISAHVDSSEFGQGLATQISTMVDKNISNAKLQVNPPALGPIEVRISVQGDSAQVWMVSHSAATRDALHASTETLRDMLGNQGFGQVSVDISQRSFQDRTPTPQTYQQNSNPERRQSSAAISTVGSVTRVSSGVLDAYA